MTDVDLGRADLLSLGTVCSFGGCGTRDFLPFSCSFCRKVYCLEHKSHGCAPESTQVLVCPICAKAVRLPTGSSSCSSSSSLSTLTEEAAAAAFDAHARSKDCDPSNYERVHGKKMRCPGGGPNFSCRERIGPSNRYECRACGATTCLRHRHGSDHGCAERAAANATAARGGGGGGGARGWASRFSGSGGGNNGAAAAVAAAAKGTGSPNQQLPSLARTASAKLRAFFACASPAGKGQQNQQQNHNQNQRVPPAAAAAAAAARRLAGNSSNNSNNKGNNNTNARHPSSSSERE